MAGGQVLETPFGKLYSTKITPDKETGIGNYSFEQVDCAMRKGVAANTAINSIRQCPYPSYAKMTADDMQALYGYLMQGLAPASRSASHQKCIGRSTCAGAGDAIGLSSMTSEHGQQSRWHLPRI